MVIISTYNRQDLLKDLLEDIQRELYQGKVLIFDDGSDRPYEFDNYDFTIVYHRFEQNHGRDNYYQLVSYMYAQLKEEKFYYFYQLPDDIRLKEYFFSEAIRIWQNIEDTKKACLSLGHDNVRLYRPCWTKFTPEVHSEYVKTQFCDLIFMGQRNFLEALEYDVEAPPPARLKRKDLGSGVGANISRRLHKKGLSMYHAKESLVEWVGCESKMQL